MKFHLYIVTQITFTPTALSFLADSLKVFYLLTLMPLPGDPISLIKVTLEAWVWGYSQENESLLVATSLKKIVLPQQHPLSWLGPHEILHSGFLSENWRPFAAWRFAKQCFGKVRIKETALIFPWISMSRSDVSMTVKSILSTCQPASQEVMPKGVGSSSLHRKSIFRRTKSWKGIFAHSISVGKATFKWTST